MYWQKYTAFAKKNTTQGNHMDDKPQSQLSTQDKEQPYRIIFEAASDGMIISDVETGLVVDANPAATEMHGYSREEFIGLNLTAYIHPNSQYLFNESANDTQTGNIFDVPAVHLRKDGSSFYVDVRRTPILFRARPCVLSIVRDVERADRCRTPAPRTRGTSHARAVHTVGDLSNPRLCFGTQAGVDPRPIASADRIYPCRTIRS